jgi:hypothetical protein
MTALLDAALAYAARGWPVFPCGVGGKLPLFPAAHPDGDPLRGVCRGECGRMGHGLYDAVVDPTIVAGWWNRSPRANIGLPTGHAFDVLDIDGPEALEALEAVGGPAIVKEIDGLLVCDDDVEGPTVSTPRGWHCYVAPTGRGNTVKLGGLADVDWRGVGGYVIAPPSVKDDGGTWDWMTGSTLDLGPDTEIRPAPAWVLSLFDRRQGGDTPPGGTTPPGIPRHAGRTGYGAAALERELGRLASAQEGTRNHQLNRSAHALGQLVGAGALMAEETGQALLMVADRIGLTAHEAEATIRSGLIAGIRSPRKVKS